jgi:hypothetical protein
LEGDGQRFVEERAPELERALGRPMVDHVLREIRRVGVETRHAA